MAISPSNIHEMLGTVVPVGDEECITVRVPGTSHLTSSVPPQSVPTGPVPPVAVEINGSGRGDQD